jgi:hypothetical protein
MSEELIEYIRFIPLTLTVIKMDEIKVRYQETSLSSTAQQLWVNHCSEDYSIEIRSFVVDSFRSK